MKAPKRYGSEILQSRETQDSGTIKSDHPSVVILLLNAVAFNKSVSFPALCAPPIVRLLRISFQVCTAQCKCQLLSVVLLASLVLRLLLWMQYNYSNYGTYVAVAYKTFAFNCKYVDTAEMLQQPKHCHSHCSLPVFLLLRSAFTIVIFIGTIVADINIFHFLLLLLFLCACTSTSSCGKCQIGNGNYRLVSRIAHQSK